MTLTGSWVFGLFTNILRKIPTYSDNRLKLIVLFTVLLGFAFAHWYGLRFQRDFPLEYTMHPFAYSVGFSKACMYVVLAIICSTFVALAAYRFRWASAKRLVIQLSIVNAIYCGLTFLVVMTMFAIQN